VQVPYATDMGPSRDSDQRPSGRELATFALVAMGAIPALFFGFIGITLGAWVGPSWYGVPLILIGIVMSVGACFYALTLGSIWGSILVASPAICVALAYVVGLIAVVGVLFSPILVLIGILLVLGTGEQRDDADEGVAGAVDEDRPWYPAPAPAPAEAATTRAEPPNFAEPAPGIRLTTVEVGPDAADPTNPGLVPSRDPSVSRAEAPDPGSSPMEPLG
jgi:hypothetical protein